MPAQDSNNSPSSQKANQQKSASIDPIAQIKPDDIEVAMQETAKLINGSANAASPESNPSDASLDVTNVNNVNNVNSDADAADSSPSPSPSDSSFSVLKSEPVVDVSSSTQVSETQVNAQQPASAGTASNDSSNQVSSASTPVEPAVSPSQNSDKNPVNPAGSADSYSGLLKVLIENNKITPEDARGINNIYLSTNRPIEEILKQGDLVSELNVTKAKAELNKIPFISVADTGVSPEVMNKIDESVASRYQVLPFAYDQDANRIKVAMADPLNITAINFIEQKTGTILEPYYASPSEVKRLISERYAQDLSGDVTAAMEETSTIDAKKADLVKAQQGGFIRAAPINKIVDTVLEYAMQSRASDVHIEPLPDKTRVRYRIDGILMEKLVLPKSVHDAVVSRIKILSDLKIDERRVPQDGRFDYATSSSEVDLRVSTMPSIHGEKVVMRLLKKNQGVPELEELGLDGLALQNVKKAIRIPYGIFLVTGPTGSGKTTSLYSILDIINKPMVNIMTLEDPVEYQMKGITQVQVHSQAGLTFATGLRSFLRQDPDIIMVGEIRDQETAELAVQASLTGHLVFSTLHTNSAAGALPRLIDMGVEPFLLSSSMILTMGQRVVRRLNEEYKEEYQPDEPVLEDIKRVLGSRLDDWCQKNGKKPSEITLFRGREDRPQDEPEFKGRIGIFEVMEISDPIKSLVNKNATSDEIEEEAMKHGMLRMKQDGYIKVLEGITTIEEVLRVAEER